LPFTNNLHCFVNFIVIFNFIAVLFHSHLYFYCHVQVYHRRGIAEHVDRQQNAALPFQLSTGEAIHYCRSVSVVVSIIEVKFRMNHVVHKYIASCLRDQYLPARHIHGRGILGTSHSICNAHSHVGSIHFHFPGPF
jgi:hypothetical protein